MLGGGLVYGKSKDLKTGFLGQIDCKYTQRMYLGQNKNSGYSSDIFEKDLITGITHESLDRGKYIITPIINSTLSIAFNKEGISNVVDYIMLKLISSGSYGQVYLLAIKDKKLVNIYPSSLSIKIPRYSDDLNGDIDVLKVVMESDNPSIGKYFLDMCPLWLQGTKSWDFSEDEPVPVILMERMDGNLGELRLASSDLEKYTTYLNICIQLFRAYIYLANKGYYYTDSKVQNILYRRKIETLEIYISDLGSAVRGDNNNPVTTFPYIYRQNLEFYPNMADLIYGIYIIYLQLISSELNIHRVNRLSYYYIARENLSSEQLVNEINMIVKEVNDNLKKTSIYKPDSIESIINLNLNFTSFVIDSNLVDVPTQNKLGTKFNRLLSDSYKEILTQYKEKSKPNGLYFREWKSTDK